MTAIVSMAAYRRICANALVAVAVLAVAGCNGTGQKTAKPAVVAAPQSVVVTGPSDSSVSYKSPDGYPELSKPLTAANTQMNNDDAKKQEDTLSRLAAKRKSGQISEAEYNRRVEEFRKLGQTQ